MPPPRKETQRASRWRLWGTWHLRSSKARLKRASQGFKRHLRLLKSTSRKDWGERKWKEKRRNLKKLSNSSEKPLRIRKESSRRLSRIKSGWKFQRSARILRKVIKSRKCIKMGILSRGYLRLRKLPSRKRKIIKNRRNSCRRWWNTRSINFRR